MKVLILILLALLALAACGGSASSTTSPAPTSCATRLQLASPGLTSAQAKARCGGYATECAPPNDCGSPEPSTTPAIESESPTASPLDSDTEGIVCADLNVLKITGDSGSEAVDTEASARNLTTDQITQAVDDRCPQLKDYIASG